MAGPSRSITGDILISHTPARAVPSAQQGLTSVFGMGTGGTLAVLSPVNLDVWQKVLPYLLPNPAVHRIQAV